jgi:hypothetical protein
MLAAAARFYARIAQDYEGEKQEIGELDKFLQR